jgi:hypothetical protein
MSFRNISSIYVFRGGNEMRKIVIVILCFLCSSLAAGAVSMRVCQADSDASFDDSTPIMVGTKLTIYVDSNSAEADWLGGVDLIKPVPEPPNPIGKLFGRGWVFELPDYVGSHFSAAGDRARVVDWEDEYRQSFELSAAGQNKAPGPWFVLDYNAVSIGDCTIQLVEYHGLEIVPVMSKTFHHVATRDFDHDGKVNFTDFAKLASYWLHNDCSQLNNCAGTNLNPETDSRVDYADVALFSEYWLGHRSETGEMLAAAGMNENAARVATSELSSQTTLFFEAQLETGAEQSTMAGGGSAPAIRLVYDGDMNPHPNTEITVYVRSDTPLFCLDAIAIVVGNAKITTAMGSYDCTEFGWDDGWNWDPRIDPHGWVEFGGVSWDAEAMGIIGYLKFRYYGGQVSVSFDNEYSSAFSWDGNSCPAVPFSSEPLIFGR